MPVPQIGSQAYTNLLTLIRDRINKSESRMSELYDEWERIDRAYTAYMPLPDSAIARRDGQSHEKSEFPGSEPLVIPFTYAQHLTVAAYIYGTFVRRAPMFNLDARDPAHYTNAKLMEMFLEHQRIQTQLSMQIFFMVSNWLKYGICGSAIGWEEQTTIKRRMKTENYRLFGLPIGPSVTSREPETVVNFQGNRVVTLDPYNMFPDPSVPIQRMQEGEFFGQRFFRSRIALKRDSKYENTDAIEELTRIAKNGKELKGYIGLSVDTNIIIRGSGGQVERKTSLDPDNVLIEDVVIDLVPSLYKLDKSTSVERWVVTIANRSLILRADPLDNDHGQYPFVAAEYNPDGTTFLGGKSYVGYLRPLQGGASWYYNSRQANVRKSLHNVIAYNPFYVNEADIQELTEGGRVRLNQAAIGKAIGDVIQQIPVADITSGHMGDISNIFEIMKRIGVTPDNLMGFPNSGRRSAREATGAFMAANGILQLMSETFSEQAIRPMVEQLIANSQQYASEEFWVKVVGEQYRELLQTSDNGLVQVTPENILGDFVFHAHDGTYPFDKGYLAGILREVFTTVAQIPGLSQQFSLERIFTEMTSMLGFKNVEAFLLGTGAGGRNVVVAPDEEVERQRERGNLIPQIDQGMARVASEVAQETQNRA